MPDSDSSTSRPAPRNRRFSGLAMVVVALLSAGLATGVTLFVKRAPVGSDNGENVGSSDAKHGDLYQCPMHPTITQDKPGDCPICGMKLVLQASSADTAATVETKGKSKVLYYRSPMDPTQTSKEPRKDTMGMDYVPVYEEEVGSSSSVEGMASVRIDPSRQQLIGLRTATATRGSVGGEWRTVGRVSVDETRVRRINIKVPAYVEDIYVDFVGKTVSKGAPLFSVYSPDLQSAQEELLLALRSQPVATELENFAGGGSMVAAARRKLELWDVPEVEVQKVEATKKPLKAVTFYSPIAGVVTKKEVVEGTQLSVGAMPYEIVDLSRVWVLADVYESELRNVRMGMPATLTLKAFPNRTFEGKVSFIAPLLDPVTRTVSVRLAFANPSGELRPDMFGEVILKAPTRDALRIPMDAVIDSGSQSVVFLALGQGKFQPREVTLGDSDGTSVEVVSGLVDGDEVVTRANFLVDSESRLRASLAALAPDISGAKTPEHGTHAELGATIPEQGARPAAPAPSATTHPDHVMPVPTAPMPSEHNMPAMKTGRRGKPAAQAAPASQPAKPEAPAAPASQPAIPSAAGKGPDHGAADHAAHQGH